MGKRIGITGNIGAGKTTVCREFERLGIPVYYADQRAKDLMRADPELRAGISQAFGAGAYSATGELDRQYLSRRVFGNETDLQRLNGLVHPVVARDALRWHAEQTAPYTLHEAAILFEIGAAAEYDAIIVVAAPYAVRMSRVTRRDGATEAAFSARAAQQWPDDQKEAAADYLITNDGRRLLLPQVLRIDRAIRHLRT